MIIKILGGGCANCKRLEQLARQVADELSLQAEFVKVTEMDDIMTYDVLSTPALVVNEEVLCSGRIPQKSEIETWLTRSNQTLQL
ncbi:MAG: TM0996/MTH895 family glutaredoxin-like protein [Anaerolineaceae bacterium]|nr:TM0996/MTH895 family glutaredoxin-like protein [Anaerolineaceae bacterium]